MTETTAESSGSTLRDTIDCSAFTTWLPTRTGSMHSCGRAAWPPRPSIVDGETVAAAIMRAGADGELADRDARHVVHAVDLLDAEALHQAVLHHRVAAAAALLGRLEDHHRRAVEVARLGTDTWRPRAAWRCARRGRRRASGRASRGVGQRRSPPSIGSASMSARRPMTLPLACAWPRMTPDDAGAADPGHHLVAAERRAACRRRRPPCGGRRRGAPGVAWISRRQAAISSAKSAMRLMTGMG